MAKTTTTLDSRSSKTVLVPPTISYKLSDKHFLDIGWTTKPNIPSAFPVVVMKAKFSHPVISPWFQQRMSNVEINYDNGNLAYLANKDGTGKIFYPNGRLAINIEKGGINNLRTRVWVYSSGEVDHNGVKLPLHLCALFDSLGNGVVYDCHMRKRLLYNQRQGILWDSPTRKPVFWKWHDIQFEGSIHLMNEEEDKRKLIVESPKQIISTSLPVSKQNVKESQSAESPPDSSSINSMKLSQSEIEFRENFEQTQYVNTAKTEPKSVSPLKPIVLRLNKYLALRIFSQSEISLNFFTKTHQTTLQIGVLYNPYQKLKVVEIDNSTLEANKVICHFEDFPANTRSMLRFRKMLRTFRGSS